MNKPGPAQVGAYPRLKNSKKTSKCQVFSFTVLENQKFFEKIFSKKLHTQKNGPSGAPGPASASPWRAKRGTLPKLSIFFSQLKGDPSEKKQISDKKSHNAFGTLWGCKTPNLL